MRKKARILLMVLSVALNIAFVAMWAVHTIPNRAGQGGRDQGEGPVWCPLHRDLGISEAQWREIEPRLLAFQASVQSTCGEVKQYRSGLIDLIVAPETDRDAILAKQEQILQGQRKVQSLVIEHLLKEKETLDARQQEAFFNMLRRRSACKGHGPMMMGFGRDSKAREGGPAPSGGAKD
ncbi:MAG: periplasmic heavy metal sensor [Planctomycetes bacterium]|nr:periplasmic heavy metal sensor [Planctomycetota bacterium]